MIGVEVLQKTGLLEQIRLRVTDPRGLLRAAGRELIDYEIHVFATNAFGAWAPLAEATLKAKATRRILVDTGGLLKDLTSVGSLRYSGDSVTLTTDHPGASHLEDGARGMPKRDPAPKPRRADTAEWSRSLLGFLTEGTTR